MYIRHVRTLYPETLRGRLLGGIDYSTRRPALTPSIDGDNTFVAYASIYMIFHSFLGALVFSRFRKAPLSVAGELNRWF